MKRRRTVAQWRARLVFIVLGFLALVVLADSAGLTNHP